MKFELNLFATSLIKAKKELTFVAPKVCEYVLKNIYKPMLHDEEVLFKNLDFNGFTDEDLQDLEHMIELTLNVENRLSVLNSVFCKSEAVPCRDKTFC